jgi:hypothetical protein
MTDARETANGVETTWRCAQPGLWVAKDADGRPVGIVSERWNDGFIVTAVNGHALGRHRDLESAKAALELSRQPYIAETIAP